MQKGNLTRDEAIAIVGLAAVQAVEAKNCEPTGRVGYNGECQGDDLCEWSASVSVDDGVLIAYYYTSNSDDQAMADGDGSDVDWVINGYEIV